jgi:hypothetical protein
MTYPSQTYEYQKESRLRKYHTDPRFRLKRILTACKVQARKGGYTPCLSSVDMMLETLTGLCHACGLPEEKVNCRLAMDHDHETGEFRGWLCHRCNATASYKLDFVIDYLYGKGTASALKLQAKDGKHG